MINASLSKMENWGTYKFIIFITFIMVLASIITFSFFLNNIYKNMDEIRRTEIEFRRRIKLNENCCEHLDKKLTKVDKIEYQLDQINQQQI